MKTLRLQLVVWYAVFFFLLILVFIIGTNITVHLSTAAAKTLPPAHINAPQPTTTIVATMLPTTTVSIQPVVHTLQSNLLVFSLICMVVLTLFAVAGGYLLSGQILKPLRLVSNAAARISQDNLKERINYGGADDDIKSLTDTFNNMMQRLQAAFETQGQFIQDASHELKTPVATAKTNIQVIKMKPQATLEDYRRALDVVEMSLERMYAVSNDLLILSDNGLAKSRWSKIDAAALIKEIYNETNLAARNDGISLKMGAMPSGINIRGDAMRLKQAVINLINNAIKYNREGGEVEILLKNENANAVIEVRDTGIGIAPADLGKVFERFFRVDKSRSRELGGSGLGLAIVKKIVEDHGGTVYVRSTPGEGSVFGIKLPILTE
jgi:signal transduction histidine kinase